MYKFLLIISISLLYSFNSFAQLNIISSTYPLTAIITMLTGDLVNIETIAKTSACPHHYQLKPSDISNIANADIVFYIDNSFDGFMVKPINKYNKSYCKISDAKDINLIKLTSSDKYNWHLWLDLDNVEIILKQISETLITHFPDIKPEIIKNYQLATSKIQQLSLLKKEKVTLQNIRLLDAEMEYFFTKDLSAPKICHSDINSLNCIAKVDKLLKTNHDLCFIYSGNIAANSILSKKTHILKLSPDNFNITTLNQESFYQYYLTLIEQVSNCSRIAKSNTY